MVGFQSIDENTLLHLIKQVEQPVFLCFSCIIRSSSSTSGTAAAIVVGWLTTDESSTQTDSGSEVGAGVEVAISFLLLSIINMQLLDFLLFPKFSLLVARVCHRCALQDIFMCCSCHSPTQIQGGQNWHKLPLLNHDLYL